VKHWIVLLVVLVLLAVRLASPSHDNPRETAPLEAPAEVLAVLERACFDCHSNLTEWPWYSQLPPASWLTGNHVVKGREHLNFSTWGELSAEARRHAMHEIVAETGQSRMPPGMYLKLHAEAALSDDDLAVIRRWARSPSGR